MKKEIGKGWKHPGHNSSNYGRSKDHDHDRRVYAGAEDSSVLSRMIRPFKGLIRRLKLGPQKL